MAAGAPERARRYACREEGAVDRAWIPGSLACRSRSAEHAGTTRCPPSKLRAGVAPAPRLARVTGGAEPVFTGEVLSWSYMPH